MGGQSRGLKVAGLVVAIGALACCGAASAKLPLAPLSTLGKLTAAPSSGPEGPEQVPVPKAPFLADPQALKLGQRIDGIQCQRTEKVLFHIHAHLTIFVSGKARQVPYGIGIAPPLEGVNTKAGPFVEAGSCFAWLHTHADDGIIHIESPVPATYILGDFFDIWGQKLTSTRVGPARGKVTAFYNGKVWTGNPRNIPLNGEAQIQLDVGTPLVAPEKIKFPVGLANPPKKK